MRIARGSVEIRSMVCKTLRGADPDVHREFFENTFHYFELRGYFHSIESRSAYLPSDAERVQGRKNRPMRKRKKRLAKTDRKQRATERRLQAPRQNSVEDSGSGGRGGRESTTRSEHGDSKEESDSDSKVWWKRLAKTDGKRLATILSVRSKLTSSEPPSGERDDSEEESADGNNYADEMASGETDDEEGEHGDSEEEHDDSEEECDSYS